MKLLKDLENFLYDKEIYLLYEFYQYNWIEEYLRLLFE